MLRLRNLIQNATEFATGVTKLKTLAVALGGYAAVCVGVLKAMHITWWSVLLFLCLLAVPIVFCLMQAASNRERRCRILYLARRRDEINDNLPDYDRYRRFASVELWQAVVMVLDANPNADRLARKRSESIGISCGEKGACFVS